MKFRNKKILNYILIILLILNIPLILYSLNFNNFVFNENFYKKEFQKHGVYDKLKNYDIEKVNKGVLDYLKYKNVKLAGNDFFNEREKTHLKDVKDLIHFISFIFYFSVFLFLILFILLIILNGNYKTIIKNIGIVFLFGGALTLLDAFIFWLLIKFNFQFTFELMHKIFFKAGTYVFDPSFENIIILYPQQFFYDITVNIVVNTLVFSLFLFLIGLFVVVYKQRLHN